MSNKIIHKDRPSYFDDLDSRSYLYQHDMVGLFNMMQTTALFYLLLDPILALVQKQSINMTDFPGFPKCLIVMPMLIAWSYTAYIIQWLCMKGLPKPFAKTLHTICHLMMFTQLSVMVQQYKWPALESGFAASLVCIFFMKMHSYSYCETPTLVGFTEFIMMPVLVYRSDLPRRQSIRIHYILIKLGNSIVIGLLIHKITHIYVMPFIQHGSLLSSTVNTMLPLSLITILMFYLVFECILNILAELSRFGDREYYTDWWNSTSFGEFNRKWNIQVHHFLYQHIYLELKDANVSNRVAYVSTFVGSAVLHEYVMAIAMGKTTPIIIGFMMLQFPVMYITQALNKKRAGNYYFWWSMIQGVPIMTNLYVRYHELNSISLV